MKYSKQVREIYYDLENTSWFHNKLLNKCYFIFNKYGLPIKNKSGWKALESVIVNSIENTLINKLVIGKRVVDNVNPSFLQIESEALTIELCLR